jgi:ribosomal protein S18 acetylase RimI-like enzyme
MSRSQDMNSIESISVRRAGELDIALLAPLFDAYRVFYGKPSDVATAYAFLLARFQQQQSVVFIALQADGAAVGFTQLYPSFSSVSAARTFILNDLYVVPEMRRLGVAISLLDTAAAYSRAEGAIRLSLSTAIDNQTAQALYASQGWVRDEKFYSYSLTL